MIETAMFVAAGFLVASLFALLMSRPLWRRAVRLTTQRLESTLPMSRADMEADKDELRAQYAIKLRNFELALDKEKAKSTRFLVDRNKSRAAAQVLQRQESELKAQLAERDNQIRVLEQHVRKGNGLAADAPSADRHSTMAPRGTSMAELTARADAGRGAQPEDQLQAENARLAREVERLRAELASTEDKGQRDWDLLKSEIAILAERILYSESKPAPKGLTAALRKGLASTDVPQPKAPGDEPEKQPAEAEKPAAALSGAGLRSKLGSLAQRLESLTESDRK